MLRLTKKDSLPCTKTRVRQLSLRMSGKPELVEQKAKVDEQLRRLRQAHQDFLYARDDRIAATGSSQYAGAQLDDSVMRVARKAKVMVDGDMEDPLYSKLFPITPTKMTQLKREDQARAMKNLVKVIRGDAHYADFVSNADEIEANAEKVESAYQDREVKKTVEEGAKNECDAILAEVKDFYNLLYSQLCSIFPREKKMIDGFFAYRRSTTTTSEKDGDEGDEEDEENEAQASSEDSSSAKKSKNDSNKGAESAKNSKDDSKKEDSPPAKKSKDDSSNKAESAK